MTYNQARIAYWLTSPFVIVFGLIVGVIYFPFFMLEDWAHHLRRKVDR